MRVPAMVLLLAPAVLLGACASRPLDDKCDKPQEYQSALSVPPVVVPAGLVPLDPARTLLIPPAAPGPQGPVSDNCLDRPPPYFRRDPNVPAGPNVVPASPATEAMPPPPVPGVPPGPSAP